MPAILASAIIAFFSTTIDDFAIMLVFFGQAQKMPDPRMGYLRVIVGETIGFSIVIVLSLFGLLLGLIVSQEYVDLVGILPIIVGLQKGYEQLEEYGYLPSCHKCCSRFNNDCTNNSYCSYCRCCNHNDNIDNFNYNNSNMNKNKCPSSSWCCCFSFLFHRQNSDDHHHTHFNFFSKSNDTPNKNDYLPISTNDNDDDDYTSIRKSHDIRDHNHHNTYNSTATANTPIDNNSNNNNSILNKRNIQYHNNITNNMNQNLSKSFITEDLSEYTAHFQDSEIASVDDDHIRTVAIISHTYTTSLHSTNNINNHNNNSHHHNNNNHNNHNNRYHHANDDYDDNAEYNDEEYTLQYNHTNYSNSHSNNNKRHPDLLGTGFLLNHHDDILSNNTNNNTHLSALTAAGGWGNDWMKITCGTWMMDKFVFEIIIMTLVLSSDNIGIYISLFASFKAWEVLVAVIVFYILLIVNIIIALMLMKCQSMVDFIQKYSQLIVPPFLIFLGLYILSGSIIWPFQPWF